MARNKIIHNDEAKNLPDLALGEDVQDESMPELVNPTGPVRPMAVAPVSSEAAPPHPPPVERWRVVSPAPGVMVLVNGCRTMMKTGKVVSYLNYDLNNLRLQGVKLEPVEAGNAAEVPTV